MIKTITSVSFGYDHPGTEPPDAHFTFDLRELFKDPHVSPEMRELTGLDAKVIQSVFRQPGAEKFLSTIVDAVLVLAQGVENMVIAFGCVGGRHRSVAFATALALELQSRLRHKPRVPITVWHRDIDKSILARTAKP
jgi:UPF0042 nucleotide-binding protein